MSHLINNELIWISIPKCASYSIETAIRNSKLKLEMYDPNTILLHYHTTINECYTAWGNKETICITRDWFDKWLSALNYIWDKIEFETEYTAICKWEEVDNEFLYRTIDTDFINNLHLLDTDDIGFKNCFFKLVKEKHDPLKRVPDIMITLISQKHILSNKKCTYEFDIKELDKFVDFIEKKFGEKLILQQSNQSTKRKNKIIINDEFKQWVWDNFEKRFEKRNTLI